IAEPDQYGGDPGVAQVAGFRQQYFSQLSPFNWTLSTLSRHRNSLVSKGEFPHVALNGCRCLRRGDYFCLFRFDEGRREAQTFGS
ncbi:MAG: hypothetical protein WBE42_21870, partial [Pseudolabrys sp.]